MWAGASSLFPNSPCLPIRGTAAAPIFSLPPGPEKAGPLFDETAAALRAAGIRDVQTGRFGADMQVSLVNDGPVTILLDTADWKRKTAE